MRRNAQFKRALKTLHGYFEVASVVGDLVNEVTRNAIEQLKKEKIKKRRIIDKLKRSPKFEIKPSCYKLNPVLDAVEENVFKSKGMRLDLSHERALDFPSSELQEILQKPLPAAFVVVHQIRNFLALANASDLRTPGNNAVDK